MGLETMRTMGAAVVALVVRFVFRTVDVTTLSAPLRAAYLLGWRGGPSPYRQSFAATLQAREQGLSSSSLVYGEAFVCVARRILHRHRAGVGGVVVDLGCGRGNVLLAALSLGAQARGVELLADHVDVTGPALRALGAEVEQGDARCVGAIEDATHVWLSWATWDEPVRAAITSRLRALKAGSVVVAVVWAVDDDAFEVLERTRAPFSWGVADVVVSRRR